MADSTTQIKFTIESGIVSEFKSRCAKEGISMTSVVRQWMINRRPDKMPGINTNTRAHRRKITMETIVLLNGDLDAESDYRDNIPEQFEYRRETADRTCELLEEAISCLEEAYQ